MVCQPHSLCHHSGAWGMALFATGDARHSGNDRWDCNSNIITESHAFWPPLTYVLCYEQDLVIQIRAMATYIQYIYIVTLIKMVAGSRGGRRGAASTTIEMASINPSGTNDSSFSTAAIQATSFSLIKTPGSVSASRALSNIKNSGSNV